MSFADTLAEARERFSEALQLLNLLGAAESGRAGPATNTDKAMKGLVLIAIYGAVERAVNSTVEQAIYEISSHRTPSSSCSPAILSIFHYTKVQAVKDCKYKDTLPKAMALLSSALSRDPILSSDNPLSAMLQNVDADTMILVARLFGLDGYGIGGAAAGRLNNLRERRNAISHGREAGSFAGERFTVAELRNVYTCADTEVMRFVETMREHCEARGYVVGAASASIGTVGRARPPHER